MKKKNLALSMTISTAILSLSAAGALAHLEPQDGEDMQKCYGVVKAGENDCASEANQHGCAGMAETDSDVNEWIKIPNGLCDKLVGGALAEGKTAQLDKDKKD